MFVLMLYFPVNNFSVMLGQTLVFMGQTRTKKLIKCLAEGNYIMTPVSLELATLISSV